MTTAKIVLKTIIELESEINNGKTAYAAGLNHASASIRLLEPGRYFADLDIHPGGSRAARTDEGSSETLQQFIDEMPWDLTDALDVEMKTYMGQQIWYVGEDVDPWDVSLFVWPKNHIASIDVIHAAKDAAKAELAEKD